MWFDITFHTTSREEIKKYLLDIVEDFSLIETRAKEITSDINKQKELISLYNSFKNQFEEIKKQKVEPINISNTLAYVYGAINWYIHPYYYSRNEWLTLKTGDKLTNIIKSIIEDENFIKKHNLENNKELTYYSVWWYVENKDLNILEDQVLNNNLIQDEDNKWALLDTIKYAKENNLGVFEASEIVIPIADECYSDFSNFKAYFMTKQKEETENKEGIKDIQYEIRKPIEKIKNIKDLIDFSKWISFLNYILLYISIVIIVYCITIINNWYLLFIPFIMNIILQKKRYIFHKAYFIILRFFIDLFLIWVLVWGISVIVEILALKFR